MTAKTRLGEEGYGVRRLGSFAGKTPDTGSGPHPVGIITRLSLDGYGARRYSSFAGKTASVEPPPTSTDGPGGFGKDFGRHRYRKLKEEWRLEALEAQREAEERAKAIKKPAARKAALEATEEAKEAIEAAQSAAQVQTLVRNLEALASAKRLEDMMREARLAYEASMRILEEEDEEEALLLLLH